MSISDRPARRRRDRAHLAAAGMTLAACLSGCVDPAAGPQAGRLDVRAAIARGDVHSPKGAAMAFASIDGAPEPIASRLKQDLASEAATREISITAPALARYFVRGYVDAYPTETGTSVHYVWDVFDTTLRRTQRVGDAFELPPSGPDPWSGVNDDVLASIAARSADDLAMFLGNTPEAAAGAAPAEAVARVPDRPAN